MVKILHRKDKRKLLTYKMLIVTFFKKKTTLFLRI